MCYAGALSILLLRAGDVPAEYRTQLPAGSSLPGRRWERHLTTPREIFDRMHFQVRINHTLPGIFAHPRSAHLMISVRCLRVDTFGQLFRAVKVLKPADPIFL
jgi:hypothetical protein